MHLNYFVVNYIFDLKVILSNPPMHFWQDSESVSFLQYFMPTASQIQKVASISNGRPCQRGRKSIDSWHKKTFTFTSPLNNFGYKHKPFKINIDK